ncbi:MAG: hypothetical protein V1776_02925 [Candidatus Diapherotrites archaeon]
MPSPNQRSFFPVIIMIALAALFIVWVNSTENTQSTGLPVGGAVAECPEMKGGGWCFAKGVSASDGGLLEAYNKAKSDCQSKMDQCKRDPSSKESDCEKVSYCEYTKGRTAGYDCGKNDMPGGAGECGRIKRNDDGTYSVEHCEFTVRDGEASAEPCTYEDWQGGIPDPAFMNFYRCSVKGFKVWGPPTCIGISSSDSGGGVGPSTGGGPVTGATTPTPTTQGPLPGGGGAGPWGDEEISVWNEEEKKKQEGK